MKLSGIGAHGHTLSFCSHTHFNKEALINQGVLLPQLHWRPRLKEGLTALILPVLSDETD